MGIHQLRVVLGGSVSVMGGTDILVGGTLGVVVGILEVDTEHLDIVHHHHMGDTDTPAGLCMVPIAAMGRWTVQEFP